MSDPAQMFKVKEALPKGGGSAFRRYRDLCYGSQSLPRVLWAEFLLLFIGGLPGALGLALRKMLYPGLFAACGKGVVFGRGITLRHAHKIRLGDGVMVDDHVVLDAKGGHNRGITIADGVYLGRHTIVYCKGGNITIERRANLSSNCQVFSSNDLTIGAGTVIGAFTYLLSGGTYDHQSPVPFADQTGMETRGPLRIGANCWLGAGVIVTDGSNIGDHCVLGAGAVVTQPIPAHQLAVGVPARPIQTLTTTP